MSDVDSQWGICYHRSQGQFKEAEPRLKNGFIYIEGSTSDSWRFVQMPKSQFSEKFVDCVYVLSGVDSSLIKDRILELISDKEREKKYSILCLVFYSPELKKINKFIKENKEEIGNINVEVIRVFDQCRYLLSVKRWDSGSSYLVQKLEDSAIPSPSKIKPKNQPVEPEEAIDADVNLQEQGDDQEAD
tara:strand:- start:155 stop:718 length:564 start_codon:yes stop_codon:yes gene_type:complete